MTPRMMTSADVADKRVLVRVDFNVPMKGDTITDDTRIRAALPTITWLREHHAKIVLCSHLGRPKGSVNPQFSLAPIAVRLSALLGADVQFPGATIGPLVAASVAALQPGDVLLLENLRFDPREEANDPVFATELASLGDLFVNDAFGAAHRAHASTEGITHLLPAYAGLLIAEEVRALGRIVNNPARPFVAILGGAKVSDKLAVLDNLLSKVDTLIVGGGMANTFLLAEGMRIGNSLAEPDLVDRAVELVNRAKELGVRLALPTDLVISPSIDGTGRAVGIDQIPNDQSAFDIGPGTAREYASIISEARTIFWNGPMGVAERPAFRSGTEAVARAVAEANGYSLVGGGDSVAALEQLGFADKIDHISTGGGASLEFVEGRTLPGIASIPS